MKNYKSATKRMTGPGRFIFAFSLLALCSFQTAQAQSISSLSALNQADASTSALGANGKIAFVRRLDENNSEIYVMNLDGSNQVNLTNNPAEDSSPVWSPDGTKIAFRSTRGQDFYRTGDIYVMNADGSNVKQITSEGDATDNTFGSPAWSPDGSKILYVRVFMGAISNFLVMNADGRGQPKDIYTIWGSVRHSPAWSPDGTRVAFAITNIDFNFTPSRIRSFIYIVNADGRGETKIADVGGPNSSRDDLVNGSPAWSPDGTKLVFVNNQDGNAEIYLMNPDGSDKKRLTNNAAQDGFPVWSPDGTKIAFTSNRDGNQEIYVMDADGSNQARLTNNTLDDFEPSWQNIGPAVVLTPAVPTLQFSACCYRLPEAGGGVEKIMVTRLGDLLGEASVDYATSDGTASAGSDYLSTSGSLKFAAGEGEKIITIPLLNDSLVEGSETVNLSLRNAQGASFGASSTAILTIIDDDLLIDDTQFFVRQHYLDFLNREPDPPGQAFWTDNITKCHDPARRPAGQTEAQCIDKQRVATSASFFLSPEFQYTGYFVYRMYKGSLTGPPNYDGGSIGRFPLYAEFVPDVQQVASGIIVNNKLSAEKIEANRAAYAEQFVGRAEFKARFDGLTNEQYVDKLFQTTGVTPTSAERQALIDGLNTQTETRGRVLRKVVDGTRVIAEGQEEFQTRYGKAFYDKEFNRAFVLMEYFGYLRRDPDTFGYNHWWGKLNYYGNYIDAEMVRSFLVSPEYRSRFGQP